MKGKVGDVEADQDVDSWSALKENVIKYLSEFTELSVVMSLSGVDVNGDAIKASAVEAVIFVRPCIIHENLKPHTVDHYDMSIQRFHAIFPSDT